MQRNDKYLINHRLCACSLCLSNSQFAFLNQKPTSKKCMEIIPGVIGYLPLKENVVDHMLQTLVDCGVKFFSFS